VVCSHSHTLCYSLPLLSLFCSYSHFSFTHTHVLSNSFSHIVIFHFDVLYIVHSLSLVLVLMVFIPLQLDEVFPSFWNCWWTAIPVWILDIATLAFISGMSSSLLSSLLQPNPSHFVCFLHEELTLCDSEIGMCRNVSLQ
jgi:hypothetical protein